MISLPTERKVVEGVPEPSKMILFSQPKTGKTSNLSELPNSLVIDLESGSKFFNSMSIDVKAEAIKEGQPPVNILMQVANAIKQANFEAQKPVYDFIIIDTTSALEDFAIELATHNYKKSVIGKEFKGSNVVTELAQGAGYGWLRDAFQILISPFQGLAGKCLIYVGHSKASSITKKGESLTAKDINLTGE